MTRRAFRWSPSRMAELEAAVAARRRVALMRRGTEYVVVAHSLRTRGRTEVLVGRVPMTGEDLKFALPEIEAFQVVAG